MVVEGLGRQLKVELLFQLHQQIDRCGRVEPKPAKFRLRVDDLLRYPEELGKPIDAKYRNLFLRHVSTPKNRNTIRAVHLLSIEAKFPIGVCEYYRTNERGQRSRRSPSPI